ncbi:MAG TPA: hypothetical protein PKX78_03015 [Candidatus Woesebacteria bacterium]|jgi:hypothetical protein|nr:hypothetical protein [Candidatus Woesebacteria bacterium]
MTNLKLNPQMLFYVTRRSLFFYAKELSDVVELPFSSEVSQDLEIISQISLERILVNWLEQLKIIPGQAILLLDESVYFRNIIEHWPASDQDPLVQDFLALVPFHEVKIKNFPLKKGACTTVINKHFLLPLIDVLEKVGFVIVTATPSFVLNLEHAKTGFTQKLATQIVVQINVLAQFSFLSIEELTAKLVEPKPFLSVKIDAKLIGMMVFLVVLSIVLLILMKVQGII